MLYVIYRFACHTNLSEVAGHSDLEPAMKLDILGSNSSSINSWLCDFGFFVFWVFLTSLLEYNCFTMLW